MPRSKRAMPQTELPAGFRIGDYTIIDEIGRGGMGAVYRASHSKLGRIVAIKLLETGEFDLTNQSNERVTRFQREQQAIGRLSHPNIVAAFDAGEFGDYHYLAMEYIEGANLQQLVHQHGSLKLADACEIARQAAQGLQHIQSAGLVHRDIKPSNVMLSFSRGKPEVKVLDLGLARFHEKTGHLQKDSLTRTGVFPGTLNYMAPEQFGTSQVDILADIFSLGATLFFLLAGRPHFHHETGNLLQNLKRRATEPIPSLAGVCEDLPEELTNLVDRMLADDPALRPTSPAEIATCLGQFTKGHDLLPLLPAHRSQDQVETLNLAGTTKPAPAVSESSDLDQRSGVASPKGSNGPRFPVVKLALVVLAMVFIALAGFVIRLQTDGGDIVIECNDPTIEIEIVRNKALVKTMEVGQLEDHTWFRSGDYEIRVPHQTNDRIEIVNQTFTLKRGKNELVTITVMPPDREYPRHLPTAKGKYVVWEFPDGGRYVKNESGTWSVYNAHGLLRDSRVNTLSSKDELPIIVDDLYHGLWFRFDNDTVNCSRDKGQSWTIFYSGKGKWILPGQKVQDKKD